MNGGLHPFQGAPASGADVPTTDAARVAARLYPYGRGGAAGLTPPPASLYGGFDLTTRRLFDRAFAGAPERRPSARDWWTHLRALLDGGLRPCGQDPDHARFGDRPCAMCGGGAGASAVRVRVAPGDPADHGTPFPLSRVLRELDPVARAYAYVILSVFIVLPVVRLLWVLAVGQ